MRECSYRGGLIAGGLAADRGQGKVWQGEGELGMEKRVRFGVYENGREVK